MASADLASRVLREDEEAISPQYLTKLQLRRISPLIMSHESRFVPAFIPPFSLIKTMPPTAPASQASLASEAAANSVRAFELGENW